MINDALLQAMRKGVLSGEKVDISYNKIVEYSIMHVVSYILNIMVEKFVRW